MSDVCAGNNYFGIMRMPEVEGTRVCNYHCTAREDEWTAVLESPNNCKNFGTTHVEAIVDLMRVSLNVVHGVVSEMLSNVLE